MSSSIASSSFIQQRKEVLRLVSNLSAAMFAKQAEQGLLMYVIWPLFFNALDLLFVLLNPQSD